MRGKRRPEWQKLPYGYRSSYTLRRGLFRSVPVFVVVVVTLLFLHAAGQRWPDQVGNTVRPVAQFVEGLFLGRPGGWSGPPSAPQPSHAALVGPARVIDGDTLIIGQQRVRLFAMDAPESDQSCRDQSGRAYACGAAATAALRQLIGSRDVSCVRKGQSYNRMVGQCHVGDVDVGREMVRLGHAIAVPQFSRIYVADEMVARAQQRGMWAGQFERPDEYRRQQTRSR